MNFVAPIDGDVLFSIADGKPHENGIIVKASVSAPSGRKITINGVSAIEKDGIYTADIYLDGYRNAIEAVDSESMKMETIYVYWFKNGYKTYRMGVDDVIRCFQNIYEHREEYTSIFDDPYLKLFYELHQKYNTFVHMHIYYETDDKKFNLSMFPDKYKDEFRANSDWLKFTFHARADNPESPYKFASYELVMKEGRDVEREILRFAGKEVMDHVTSQHFGDSNLWATRAFRNLGFKCIDGYFIFDDDGNPYVSYYLNKEQTTHAASRDFWVDNKEDIIFVKDDIVIDQVSLDKIDDYMEKISSEKNHCFHYLLIHEQYFYEDYFNYEPDYKERVFAAVDWCHRNGYKPVSMSSIIFE